MFAIFAWILAHGAEIFTALFAIHAAAVTVVNLTPTPKDDEIVAKYYKIIEIAAGLFTRLAKK